VIRETIKQRYDLIHYIYTAFYWASQEAELIFKPMWSEWPKDASLITNESQFMFGRSILVCPKLTPKNVTSPDYGDEYFIVNCTLPLTEMWGGDPASAYPARWYDMWTKKDRFGSLDPFVMEIPDILQGLWARGGSIIPIMLHDKEMSVIQMLNNSISLHIYPDV